ncbi:hypothetical protein E3N88_19321 [Mikania micrantha]|uniref:CCHC-type domain-containing protein n=1 Tax=Mikania micrantha TaxID=192012 RepID=A0A5N6NQ86_9ASTR|nr:hypothetical protein E3N88_19321 [Mikania micrantha]
MAARLGSKAVDYGLPGETRWLTSTYENDRKKKKSSIWQQRCYFDGDKILLVVDVVGTNLSKLEFIALDISRKNFLPWTLDAQIHLTAKNLGEIIVDSNETSLQDKAKAMIFLRHHLHEDLKREYLTSKRGRGRSHGLHRGRGRGRSNTWHRESHNTKIDGGRGSSRQNTGRPHKGRVSGDKDNICYRCGMSNHWSRTCRTPKHLVESYQRTMKEKGKQTETNLIEGAPNSSSPAFWSDTHLEACDFIENVRDV